MQVFFFMLALLFHLGVQIPARGGSMLVYEERRAGDDKIRTTRFQVSDEGLRVAGVRGKNVTDLIYQKAGGLFILIDEKSRTYREISRAQLIAAASKAQEAMDQLEEKLSGLSASDRESIGTLIAAGRHALAQRSGGSEVPSEFVRSPLGDMEFLGQQASLYLEKRGGETHGELFTVPAEALGLSSGEVTIFAEVASAFEEAVSSVTGIKNAATFLPEPGNGKNYEGFPVRRLRFEGEVVVSEWRLRPVKRIDLDASIFAPPSGYEKRSLF